jgi:hypothetical protein
LGEYVVYDSEWETRFEREGETTHILFSRGNYTWHIEYKRHLEEVNITITLYFTDYEIARTSARIIGKPDMRDLWFSDMQEFRKTLDMHGARKTLKYIFNTILDYFRGW